MDEILGGEKGEKKGKGRGKRKVWEEGKGRYGKRERES